MSQNSDCARPVKSNRAARGLIRKVPSQAGIRRRATVGLLVHLEGQAGEPCCMVVDVPRSCVLRALARVQERLPGRHRVPICAPFGGGDLVVGG